MRRHRAVIGPIALILARPAAELRVGHDQRVVPTSQLDQRRPHRRESLCELLEQRGLLAGLVLMRVEAVEREPDHRHALPVQRLALRGVSSSQHLHRSLDRSPKRALRKSSLERELTFTWTQPVSGLHDIVLDVENMRQLGIALMKRHRRRKPRSLDELRRVHQCNGPRAVGERPHLRTADHHAVRDKTRRHCVLCERACQPAFAQILIRARRGVPYLDRAEVREIRLRVADALHDGQLLALP